MNDRLSREEFSQRLLANPQDDSPEFQANWQGDAARTAERDRVREFDTRLRYTLCEVNAPADLKQKLLDPTSLASSEAATGNSANAGWFSLRRILPVAACLLLAIGILLLDQGKRSADTRAALSEEILAHVYNELAFLEFQQALPLQLVNTTMDEAIHAKLALDNKDMGDMKVTYASDCWVARHISFHLIMKGRNSPVSVLIIPNPPVDSEFDIADERFEGLVTPTSGGNLVVIGEKHKREPIHEYRTLLTHNLHWKY